MNYYEMNDYERADAYYALLDNIVTVSHKECDLLIEAYYLERDRKFKQAELAKEKASKLNSELFELYEYFDNVY